MTAFDEAWDIAKRQGNRIRAERAIEEDEFAPVKTPLPVSGNKGNLAGLLRNVGNRLRTQEVYDPFMGGGQVGFAIRPDRLYAGNDLNYLIPRFFKRMQQEPDALRWNMLDAYSLPVGSRPTIKKPDPLDTRVAELPEITQPFADAWHEATGGYGLPEDRMLNIPIAYRMMQARLNEILANPESDRQDSDLARERDRLIAMMFPQQIGGHFRVGERTDPETSRKFLVQNIGPRGPSPKPPEGMTKRGLQRRLVEKIIGDKVGVFDEYADAANLAMAGVFGGAPPIKADQFFYPDLKVYGLGAADRFDRDPSDEDYNYDVYSRIIAPWVLDEGEADPFMDTIAEVADPDIGLGTIDPPYLGDEVGEHRVGRDWGEEGGFKHNLMSNLRGLTDQGLPVMAFDTGDSGKSPSGETKRDIMRRLYGLGGLDYRQLLDRKNLGVAQKDTSYVGESMGTNIPWLTQDAVSRLVGDLKGTDMALYPEGYRGSWRHNAFGTSPT